MLDKEKLLRVADFVVATEQANERVTAAQTRLEAARAVVEAVRLEISEAKEGVATAKAALDTAVASIENTGLSKAAIIKAAEDLNRVFQSHGIFVVEQATDEAEAEPEVSRLTLKKLGERVADKIAGFTDAEDAAFDRDAVLALLADIQQVVSEGAPAGKASKDAEAAPTKRKRRGKADAASESSETAAETTVADQPTDEPSEFSAAVADLVAAEEILIVETLDETTAASAIKAAEIGVSNVVLSEAVADAALDGGQIEHNAHIEIVSEAAASVDQDEVIDEAVAEEAPAAEVEVAEIASVAEIAEIPAVDNAHVRDEVIELIDSNVTEDDLSGIVSTVAYAVFVKADAEQTALTVYSYLDLMTVETVAEISAAPYADRLAGELEALASDPEYTAAVLAWFRNGVALIEEGKDFPQFTGVASAQVAEEVTPVEIVAAAEEIAAPAANEVFTADQDLPEEAEAVESIGDVDFLSQAEEPAPVVAEPAVVETPAPAPVAAQPTVVEPPKAPTPFAKPGFMKPSFMTNK
jgi:hypothetical protein